jgi:hypothetical protein
MNKYPLLISLSSCIHVHGMNGHGGEWTRLFTAGGHSGGDNHWRETLEVKALFTMGLSGPKAY